MNVTAIGLQYNLTTLKYNIHTIHLTRSLLTGIHVVGAVVASDFTSIVFRSQRSSSQFSLQLQF
jgi:hypothetical protein